MVVEMKAYAGMHNLLPPWMERGTLRALGSFSGKRIKMPERSQSNQSQYSQLGHGNQFTIFCDWSRFALNYRAPLYGHSQVVRMLQAR